MTGFRASLAGLAADLVAVLRTRAELFGLVVSAQGSSMVKGGGVQTDKSKSLRKCLAAQLDLWL